MRRRSVLAKRVGRCAPVIAGLAGAALALVLGVAEGESPVRVAPPRIIRTLPVSGAGVSTIGANWRIVQENSFPGTTAWKPDPAHYRVPTADADGVIPIRGYASATSVNHGEQITFYVTNHPGRKATDAEPTFDLEIFRLGYYGGTGGRSLTKVSSIAGTRQPPCVRSAPPPAGSGLVECHWSPSYTLAVPAAWTSGVYVAQLINSEHYETYVPFVVRDDAVAADFLYQQPVATYQAYNNFGGRSLYKCDTEDCPKSPAKLPGTRVSFDRPYADQWGAGQLFYRDFSEQKFIFHLEQMGYDVTYSTDVDTHANPARLLTVRGFLAVGHGEYWSREMYDAMQVARDHGTHLAFFSGNTGYWQIRFEPSTTGVPNRTIVCYKAQPDPNPDPAYRTRNWRTLGRPEQTLLGVQWGNGMDYLPGPDGTYAPGTGFPLTVHGASHWIYAGTGVQEGQQVADVVGQEWDSVNAGTPLPPNTAFDVVAHTTMTYDPKGVPGSTTIYPPPYYSATADTVVYTAYSGALVFNAGTIIWGHAMDESPIVLQMTHNVLDRFLAITPDPSANPLVRGILSINAVVADD